jgi:cell division protein DivIC
MKERIDKLPSFVKNKYFIASCLFIIWVTFFDQNNLIGRYKHMKYLQRLNDDQEYYEQRIQNDAARLKDLKTNKENLEKFAREEYFMKRSNEDIFIIVEED